ncbi:MAG: serine/threonine-protein kinase [Stagnimonas sp.]|nr:serine/threonine-protein kinase [Stagnimonas sp.]
MSDPTVINFDTPIFGGPAPNKIGKYEIAGLLGKGASGLVYKGFDPFVRRDVAVKIALQLSEEPRHLGGKDSPAASFFTEARAAGMLNHPNLVALYDAGMEVDLCYIVMEYIDGDTLQPWCRKEGPRMPLEKLLDVMARCARGLDYSHTKGVLHRDIKPTNIMMTRDGVPKIMDFSIAEINERKSEDGMNAVGSPLYMSPEQVTRQPLGPTSDLYALGAVMYQLLTGETPFFSPHLPGLFAAIRNLPAPPVEKKRPDVPRDVALIVAKLLAKKPADRYQSGKDLASDLNREYERLRQSDAQATRRENRDSLRGLSFFNAFTEIEVDEVLSACQLKTYQPGKLILEEGELDNAFFILAMGQAIVKKGDKPIHVLTKGDCFGEIGLLSNARRTASVVAASQVLALKINASLLDNLATDSQLRFYKTFTQTLIYRLTVTSARLSAATPSA